MGTMDLVREQLSREPGEGTSGYISPENVIAAIEAVYNDHEPRITNTTDAWVVHFSDTTDVHGIVDTAALVTTDDSRLTDSRTPSSTLAHVESHHTGGSDALAPSDIDAVPSALVGNLLSSDQAYGSAGWGLWGDGDVTYIDHNATITAAGLTEVSLHAFVMPVVSGATYTFGFEVVSITGGRGWKASIQWKDEFGGTISTVNSSVWYVGTTGRLSVSGTAPVGAVSAQVVGPTSEVGSVSDSCTVTRFTFHRGLYGDWTEPGIPVTGTRDVTLVPSDIGASATGHTHATGDISGLGTAATKDVPASGNATATQVVKGDDTRLADSRTPLAHSASHAAAGSDPVTPASIAARAENLATFSDANHVCAASTRVLMQTGTMSAPRTVTLPAANALPAGAEIIVGDASSSVTATNTITIARAGSDTINGATSVVIGGANGWRRFVSNGVSAWSWDAGVLRSSNNLSDVASAATALANLGGITATIVDVKGDIVVASGADAVIRLPVGVAGTNPLLTPDTSASGGLAWKSHADADVAKASQIGNLLTANIATGTDALGTVAGAAAYNEVPLSSTAQAYQGSRSLAWTNSGPTGARGIYVSDITMAFTAGEPFTFLGVARGDSTADFQATVEWYNGSTYISATSTTVAIGSAGWTPFVVVATVPATATRAKLRTLTIAGPVGTYYLDALSFHRGRGGRWSEPGVPITGLQELRTYTVADAAITLNRLQPVVTAAGGNVTYTLPLANDNTGVQFTILNRGTGTVTLSRTIPDTINGLTSVTIPGTGFMQVISTGSAWIVLNGEYTTHSAAIATTGKGTWAWDQVTPGWRLIAYDTGWRSITEVSSAGVVTGDALTASWQPLADTAGWIRVRRNMDSVKLSARYIQVTTASPTTGLWAPATGFAGIGGYVPLSTSGGTVHHAITAGATYASPALSSATVYVQGQASWSTTQAPPASLPGTQVTAPV